MNDLEERTRAYGREIFARLDRAGPVLFSPSWWDERLMEWGMRDERIKVQLFRFIDVLPQLRSPASIARHLREYFNETGTLTPGWVRQLVRLLPERGLAGRVFAGLARRSAERMARRFIAGSNPREALEAVARLRGQSLAFTVDLLGEATITETEAERNLASYLELLDILAGEVNGWREVALIDRDDRGPIPRVNVSLKLSALDSQFDPLDPRGTSRAVKDRLRPILRAARRRRAFVNFDMEQYAYKDLTLRIFRDILGEDEFVDWPDVGIAIQTYLRDTENDLLDLLRFVDARGAPVGVRLIKGAYWDYESVLADQNDWPLPVFGRKWQTDANHKRLTLFLLRYHDRLRPALGSHNVRSLAYALAAAESLGLAPSTVEFQMLYGMAEPIKEVLVGLGRRVRVYAPYGKLLPGMAYLVRRLLENTANESFLRASFTENLPEEQLLMNPLHAGDRPTIITSDRNGQLSSSPAPAPRKRFENEPLTDFSREENREAMERALPEVSGRMGRRFPLVLNGQLVRSTAEPIRSVNPSHSNQTVGFCDRATVEHARQAVAYAKAALPAWRDTDPRGRVEYLVRAAEVLRRRRFELAAWEVHECGKQWREADADVAEAIDYCRYYGDEMLRLAEPQRFDVAGEENAYFYEPRGVAVVIAPWNFPLAILCGMTTAALATGNTVVMKPAEQSSVMGALLMEVFQEAGLPRGVVQYLPGDGEEIGPVLVGHPDVALIAFTGSRGVGLTINRQAADAPEGQDHVKRVLAEMGGKNAVIVDDDADLDEAVHGVLASAFGYQGQKCSACSRAVVLEGTYRAFLERLVEAARSLHIAPAEDPGCAVGPVIDGEARDRILGFIEMGKSEAHLAYAGSPGALAEEGFYVGPHIFAEVPPQARIAQEEIFGPVLAVIEARDMDHALEIANGTAYALTGGLYSRSPEHIARVKREFRVGNLYINRRITGALAARQPFGGFKLSGIGSKAGGPDYLLQFVLPRTITENTMRRGFAPDTA